jgi:hypothetical protein
MNIEFDYIPVPTRKPELPRIWPQTFYLGETKYVCAKLDPLDNKRVLDPAGFGLTMEEAFRKYSRDVALQSSERNHINQDHNHE